MAQFVMLCLDKPASLALRMATREAHLAYVASHRDKLQAAGPLLDEEGGMRGSLFLLDVADIGVARALNAQDPYTLAGLFERVEIHPWRQSVGVPL